MTLPITPPLEPMLARAADEIPGDPSWRYEPKWDGFRAIVFRDGDDVVVGSRKGQPLQRYFPEILEPLKKALPMQAVVDGEIIIATSHGLDFDALQMRLHPAASRVARLAAETPATVILFDLLAEGADDLRTRPLVTRRELLLGAVVGNDRVALTPQTADVDEARQWFTKYEGAGLDGLIAKPEESTYRSGERGWTKIKHLRTVDCVVGGYRLEKTGRGVGSLLLGLYDEAGVLHHVGHTSGFAAAERRTLVELLTPLEGGDSFGHGRTPGAPSRWTRDKEADWIALRPELVCEVSFDHLQGNRFRHAARFLRWREDRDPLTCTYDQLTPADAFRLSDIVDIPDAAG
jgi:ATP-dependent DNA ligase